MISKAVQAYSRHLVLRVTVVAVVAAFLGAVIGVGSANAEWSYNLLQPLGVWQLLLAQQGELHKGIHEER